MLGLGCSFLHEAESCSAADDLSVGPRGTISQQRGMMSVPAQLAAKPSPEGLGPAV